VKRKVTGNVNTWKRTSLNLWVIIYSNVCIRYDEDAFYHLQGILEDDLEKHNFQKRGKYATSRIIPTSSTPKSDSV
jgi:hypothetical protein